MTSSSEVVALKEETSTVQSLKEEFTQRIADTERKAQVACKERDIAKKVPYFSPGPQSSSFLTVPSLKLPALVFFCSEDIFWVFFCCRRSRACGRC